jgi:glutamate-1-semialdehyde 2,1-aminomutase
MIRLVAPNVEHVHVLAGSNERRSRARSSDAFAAARAQRGDAPPYVSRARGAYVWDVDANRYVDYVLGFGTVVLGHADARVDAAVVEQLALGTCTAPLPSPRQVELTELLVSIVPGAEQAFLVRTGSDATSVAVRLARIHTGRPKVARWGYNGWHDWACPRPDGIPPAVLDQTLRFDYGDSEALERLFDSHPDQIACVLMMPFELEHPPAGFLQDVQAVAHRHGALFVLDELRSGFRIALGGAQERFDVTADLAVFGKAMANGYPIAAVTGRADVLRSLGRTVASSTSFGNAAEMAAALATITVLRETNALERVWSLGELLTAGLRAVVAETGVPAEVVGHPVMPFLRFARDEPSLAVKRAFFAAVLERGVFLHPDHHWFVSAAHTVDDIELTVDVCRRAAEDAVAL